VIVGRKSRLLDALSLGAVVPELQITLRVQSTLLEQLSFFCENILQSDTLVGEDLDMSAIDLEMYER
jgi:hypothetical protein